MKTEIPLVSVIIPNYNHREFLEERINSVLNQTYQDFEVIILDDSSDDLSEIIIEKYRDNPKVSKILFNEKNSGSPCGQWEKGIEAAKGEFIWIAESDDTSSKHFLEKAMSVFNQNSQVSLYYCRSIRLGSQNIPISYFWPDNFSEFQWKSDFEISGAEFISKFMRYFNAIPNTSSAVFRSSNLIKDYLKEVKQYKYCGDWLFWIKILKATRVSYSKLEMNYFRIHEKTTRSNKSILKEIARFREYASIIRYVNINFISDNIEITRYDWFYKEWKGKMRDKSKFMIFFPPPLPVKFIYHYYKWLLLNIVKV